MAPDTRQLSSTILPLQDTNKVLAISRVLVSWQPVGLAVGVYDMVSRYVQERKQFDAPLAAFQVSLTSGWQSTLCCYLEWPWTVCLSGLQYRSSAYKWYFHNLERY